MQVYTLYQSGLYKKMLQAFLFIPVLPSVLHARSVGHFQNPYVVTNSLPHEISTDTQTHFINS